jgi:fimbrial chaperone protein
MAPGQATTTLTVINQGTSGSAIQVRAFAWAQADGEDQLTISDGVLVSPPLATIAPGATQIVRLLLRRPPQGQEATFRILLDQIPPAAAAGTVRVALRLSIPIFALPPTRAFPHVQFRVVSETGQAYLVAHNDGDCHETIRDIELTTSEGAKLKTRDGSPYILAGATRRWPIVALDHPLPPHGTVRLMARGEGGAIDELVPVVTDP